MEWWIIGAAASIGLMIFTFRAILKAQDKKQIPERESVSTEPLNFD